MDATLLMLLRAYDRGQNHVAGLRRGDTFIGAPAAAVAAGYMRGTKSHGAFIDGFKDGMERLYPSGIVLRHADNVIECDAEGEPSPGTLIDPYGTRALAGVDPLRKTGGR